MKATFSTCTTVWFLMATVGLVAAQRLEINPVRIPLDGCATIRVQGLSPGARVTIRGYLKDGEDQPWESRADFVADAEGNVDTSTQTPVSGSYKDLSAMGLVWSMTPTKKGVERYHLPHGQSQLIDFDVMAGGKQVATGRLEQDAFNNVRQAAVDGDIHGILFSPQSPGRHPGILVVGGSEGGVPADKAAWLASHGYVALALAYFRYADLPPKLEAIPLEYFGRALGWMLSRPDVLPDQVGVVGTSRGGELALQLAAMYPQLKAVIAYVPANVRYPACCGGTSVPYAWSWQGRGLAFAMPWRQENPLSLINAEISVEHTHGPVLLIGGEDDHVWPSGAMVDAIAARLKKDHFPYEVEALKYKHAGHRAGRPEIVPTWHGVERHPVSGKPVDVGGSPSGDAESSLDAIPKVLAFLQAALDTHGH
jgi:dienelactone hydrolase